MWRHSIKPRPDWERIVTEQGLVFPVTELPDGTKRPYWNESAWYEVTGDEVDMLEAATEELWAMCVDAAGHMAATMSDQRLGLPAGHDGRRTPLDRPPGPLALLAASTSSTAPTAR